MASSTEFLALPGSPAYSPFRLAELKDSLNASLTTGPKVTEVRSIHVHYVDAKNAQAISQLKKTDSEERKILDSLLVYGVAASELAHDAETEKLAKALAGEQVKDGKHRLLLYVVPRKGTISPWSSKATSIATVCELSDFVQRIERGVLISLVLDGEYKNSQGPYPFADILHDRMTQVSSLQRHIFPKPNNLSRLSNPIRRALKHSSALTPLFPLARSTSTLHRPLPVRRWKPPTRSSVSHLTSPKSIISSRRSLSPALALATPTMWSFSCSPRSTLSTVATSSSMPRGRLTALKSPTPCFR